MPSPALKLWYDAPAQNDWNRALPIGNGRMGSLVWTTPQALHFQINRVDLFCMGNNSRSFPMGNNAYSGGCGYVDIGVEGYGDDIFTGRAFRQHLSVYDGLTTVTQPLASTAASDLHMIIKGWLNGVQLATMPIGVRRV